MQAVTAMHEDEPDKALSIDSLTAAETAMAERQAAQSITTLGNEQYPQAQLLGALGWVMWRRKDARMRFDTYMSGRTLTEITRELGLTADEEVDDDDEEGKDTSSDDVPTSPS
jgi:hypothetical protein